VQDHAVVLEAEPAGQLGELRALARGLAAADHLGGLLVQEVHLLDIPGVELEVLLDLRVRDPVEALEVVELLDLVVLGLEDLPLLVRHGAAPFRPPLSTLADLRQPRTAVGAGP
jgi:hypothetical protein